ncbi:tRNA (N6-isopentenyl adenosine(37)-C2)-methylthiotransferase MiaB [Rhodohalobacter sp. SW132]|uniref:tRNA (N6-isopentenyl adenosine(37)-C2)-methylthiotransferase MiaB n=1 Tax=Rhodohalobacter sp. SW132 TaxID=2293433 RepID=UPI000E256B72|nr:tRNA (N6-isopentenyl adenosine(37)-C2)-methylthiotransferase MiaB [Rhodohalobacter sp. SW132]REL29081.1 tRNA (N6-isopentenyl adenosine(37)-C2)-methylthiotransferase MiaB [Rhodohalobacter sp. SW132]
MTDKKFYIETYGCQMNFADTEVVNSILIEDGMTPVQTAEEADIIFVNTCSIRENAETRVWNRLKEFRSIKREKKHLTVGVMGCMAERVKDKIIDQEQLVDIVVGPDAYRDIPNLLAEVDDGRKAVNVLLSLEETYADITPVRTSGNGLTAFVSIMRGCDNMCAFCVVPFTRGRERSRPMESILREISQLSEQGYKEVTLLGQNVNSYKYQDIDFTRLMDEASKVDPEMRFRFSSPHPKDFPEPLLHLIAERPNLCNYIHIPAQAGSDTMLERMRRPYTREQYLKLTNRMREIIPGVSLSTDIIAGFCGETEEEHKATMSLMKTVEYDLAYMFAYSERERTLAHRKYEDDVPEEVKKRRLSEIIKQQMEIQEKRNKDEIGKIHIVLAEGTSKKSDEQLSGRSDTNKMVVFDREHYQKGDYVAVEIEECTSATLIGKPLYKTTTQEFFSKQAVTA